MKKSLIISSLSLALILIFASSSSAQLKEESWHWTLNLGYAPVSSGITGESLSGYSFNTTVEKMIDQSQWAIGLNVAFTRADDETAQLDGGGIVYTDISSTSLFFTAKYYTHTGSVAPYIGFGLGLNYANNNLAFVEGTEPPPSGKAGSVSLSSVALALPIGMNFFINQHAYLGFNVVPLWSQETFFKNNLNFLLNLSLGFQF